MTFPAPLVSRVAAHVIDVVAPSFVLLVLLAGSMRTRYVRLAVVAVVLGLLAWAVFVVWSSCVRQGRTGQSLGKRVLGIRLVDAATGRPVGVGRAVLRQVAHLLDTLPFLLGYLWPVWDEWRQTFADKVCSTLVVRADVGP